MRFRRNLEDNTDFSIQDTSTIAEEKVWRPIKSPVVVYDPPLPAFVPVDSLQVITRLAATEGVAQGPSINSSYSAVPQMQKMIDTKGYPVFVSFTCTYLITTGQVWAQIYRNGKPVGQPQVASNGAATPQYASITVSFEDGPSAGTYQYEGQAKATGTAIAAATYRNFIVFERRS